MDRPNSCGSHSVINAEADYHEAHMCERDSAAKPATVAAGNPTFPGTQARGLPGRWNACCSCPFSALPDDLVTHMLEFLDRRSLLTASGVCSRFNFLVEQPFVWRRLALTNGGAVDDAAGAPCSGIGLARLLERQSRSASVEVLDVPRLTLGADAAATAKALAALRLPRLQEVDVSGALASLVDAASGIGAAALRSFLVAHAPQLTRLVLDGAVSLNDGDVAAVLAAAPRLKHLSLVGCAQLTDAALAPLLLQQQQQQQAGAGVPPTPNPNIVYPPPRLSVLRVNGCIRLTGATLAGVARTCAGRLRVLEARGVPGIGDAVLTAIASTSPSLSQLDIGRSDPFGASRAPPGCVGGSLSCAGLRALASRCRGLTVLRMQGLAAIGDDDIAAAVGCLDQLAVLDARGCRGLGAKTVRALATGAAAARLVELRLFNCDLVGDEELKMIGKAMRRLETLDIYGCRRASADVVISVIQALSAPPCVCTAASDLNRPSTAATKTRVASECNCPMTSTSGRRLRRAWVGGIPSVRAALPRATGPTSGLAAVVNTHRGDTERYVQMSALFPASVDVRIF